MKFNNKYHPKSFIPKIILGKMFFPFSGTAYQKGDLLVLNYHSTPEWLMPMFEEQLKFYADHFTFLNPSDLPKYYNPAFSNDYNNSGPFLLFTFDDGLKNNIHAASMLEKYNTSGLFFIVPAFYNSEPKHQLEYYSNNIREYINKNIDFKTEDVSAMSYSDMEQLLAKGHLLGSHSLTHTMKHSDSLGKIHDEVLKSKFEIESRFSTTIENFCAPFNSILSTGVEHLKLISQHYSFYHSTIPGSNNLSPDPFFIRRTNVETFWPVSVIKYAISNLEWARYKKAEKQFAQVILDPALQRK